MLRKMIRALSCPVLPRLFRYMSFSEIAGKAQQEAQLRAMNDLELKDLGIGASEIPALLRPDMPPRAEDSHGNRYPFRRINGTD